MVPKPKPGIVITKTGFSTSRTPDDADLPPLQPPPPGAQNPFGPPPEKKS